MILELILAAAISVYSGIDGADGACIANASSDFSYFDMNAGELLMVGEMHGTNEVPAAVGGMICAMLSKNEKENIVLFIEAPDSDQGKLGLLGENYFLDKGSVFSLLEGTSWVDSHQDGRDSRAMLELVNGVYFLKKAGKNVDVFAIDRPNEGGDDRSLYMAESIFVKMNELGGDYKYISITGNYHNMRRADGLSVFDRLNKMGVSAVSLRVSASGGSAWQCRESCGVKQLQDVEQKNIRGIFRGVVPGNGHDGIIFVGEQTPSFPFVFD